MTNDRDAMPLPSVPESAPDDRRLDFASLKALAHPLRIRLLDVLSSYGAQTASTIAHRLGESSGSTSYHLRQLAKHGFVREVAGKGTARERWWERPPGSLTVTTPELASDPASLDAVRLVNSQLGLRRAKALDDFLDKAFDVLPEDWTEASMIATLHTHLTVDQLADITRETEEFLRSRIQRYRGQQDAPGTRPVQIQFNAFPLLDT
jgi:DNA-binding transcriptional ArsR family regulator